MKYRPEIDGLRSLAVIPVVMYHAGLGPFQGGFAGVDIFFVISGFLITTLLIDDIESGKFSIWDFYERRARRILPALFFVMLCSVPAAYLWMFPLELNDFAQSIVATSLFSSNILFWLESGYFSLDSELKPLLHTWSLAVEEQYYLVFPVLLFALWRVTEKSRRVIAYVLTGLALLSFFLAVFSVEIYPDAVFYLFPFRAWELLVGAIAGFWVFKNGRMHNDYLAVIGLLLLIISILTANSLKWPSTNTLLPVLGTTLVILFASADRGVGRLLSLPPLVFVGLLSYSLYLWHQPVLAFARIRSVEELGMLERLLLVMLSFALAYLTWKYVERPFRLKLDGGFLISRFKIFVSAASIGFVFICLGLWGDYTDGMEGRLAPSGLRFSDIVHDIAGSRVVNSQCDTDITFKPVLLQPSPSCIFRKRDGVPVNGRAIVIGDSHATVLTEALRDRLVNRDYDVAVMTYGGCSPFVGYSYVGRDCDSAMTKLYEHLEKTDYALIVVAARAQYLFSSDASQRIQVARSSEADYVGAIKELIRSSLLRLIDVGADVIYFDPVPEAPFDVGAYSRKSYAFSAGFQKNSQYAPSGDRDEALRLVLEALSLVRSDNFFRVPTQNAFCNSSYGKCLLIDSGKPLYYDDNHLSKFGVEKLMPVFDDILGSVLAGNQI